MKYFKKIIVLFLVASMLAGVLSGCDTLEISGQNASEEEFVGLEEEPDLNYEIPKSTVGILVNQVGYKPKEDKVIIFQGKQLPKEFSVILEDTGEVVYEGMVEEEDGIGYGDFTEFEREGNYHIYCDRLGNSYSFEIKEDLYAKWSDAYFDGLKACFSEDTKSVAEGLSMLLFSYELNPDIFVEEKEEEDTPVDTRLSIAYEICVRLLENQQVDGGIAATLVNAHEEEVNGEIDVEATFLFAASMAKFSYLYQSYDSQMSNLCLKAGDKAWRYAKSAIISQPSEEYDNTYQFYAATELFRSTGSYTYHSEAKSYMQQYEEFELKNRVQVLGIMTYLSTKRRVDIELCSRIMKQIMNASEEISKKSKNSQYLVETDPEKEMDTLLWDMVILSISDSVLSTKEYATVLENHVHFLMGRNKNAISYLSVEGGDCIDEDLQIETNLERSTAFLFLFSNIV